MKAYPHPTYWQMIWKQFRRRYLGLFALAIVLAFCLIGIYAPFLASSKPLMVYYDGELFFPLFRYLFFKGFFSKGLDLFYNLLIFTFPLLLSALFIFRHSPKKRNTILCGLLLLHFCLFIYLFYFYLYLNFFNIFIYYFCF